MGSLEQTSTVNMIPTTRMLAGIMGRLQCKTAADSDYTRGTVTPPGAGQADVKRAILSLTTALGGLRQVSGLPTIRPRDCE